MRFPPYLLGLILGFGLGFGITWDYFHKFNSYSSVTYFLIIPIIVLALVYGISDYLIWGNR